jgi:hypothetical protein
MQELKEIIELVKHKYQMDLKRDEAKFMDNFWLLDAIAEEVEEVRAEVKVNNIAHLEDELSDILWGWLTLIENLKANGYVNSHEAVIKRALKKYEERILPLHGDERDHAIWREVKMKQKEVLKKEKFRHEVREYYKPYYENSDEAHLIDHADDVCDLALKINQALDEKLIVLASYLHDMFSKTNRAIHNELAYEYVKKADDKFLSKLSTDEVKIVAHAVLEHRGSFKGEFYSPLSEIISSADRGLPDLDFIVIRSMKFNHGDAKDVYTHIHDKYGTTGYAKYPKVYQNIFKEELACFKKLADELTVDKVVGIWNLYHRN